MFRFEEAAHLYFLAVIPILIAVYALYRYLQKINVQKLSDDELYIKLVPHLSWFRRNLKFAILMLSLLFIILAWANPQWGNRKEKVKATSSDIFIALDISQSMMAEDISPNRLERSKRLALNILQGLKGNRVGLIFFAGSAYLQMPLTNDLAAAQIFIQSANTNQAGTQGTAIGEAIDLAQKAFQEETKHQRALVILTDGENHDDEAISMAKTANEGGLKIFTIGIGTEEGGFVPYIEQGREQYKRDEDGNPVKSQLNIGLLKDLAENGGGSYYLIQEGEKIIPDLKAQLDKLEKQEVEQKAFSDYASYFQYFLALGILFLILEYIISEKSSGKNRKKLVEI